MAHEQWGVDHGAAGGRADESVRWQGRDELPGGSTNYRRTGWAARERAFRRWQSLQTGRASVAPGYAGRARWRRSRSAGARGGDAVRATNRHSHHLLGVGGGARVGRPILLGSPQCRRAGPARATPAPVSRVARRFRQSSTRYAPAHGLPFHGLHTRVERLREHPRSARRAIDATREQATADEVLPSCSRGARRHSSASPAETLAHLHYLECGARRTQSAEDGVQRFRRVERPGRARDARACRGRSGRAPPPAIRPGPPSSSPPMDHRARRTAGGERRSSPPGISRSWSARPICSSSAPSPGIGQKPRRGPIVTDVPIRVPRAQGRRPGRPGVRSSGTVGREALESATCAVRRGARLVFVKGTGAASSVVGGAAGCSRSSGTHTQRRRGAGALGDATDRSGHCRRYSRRRGRAAAPGGRHVRAGMTCMRSVGGARARPWPGRRVLGRR